MVALVAVLWAVYLAESLVRWRPGDWIFCRRPWANVEGLNRPDVTLWNERFSFVWTSVVPAIEAYKFAGAELDGMAARARVERHREAGRWLKRSSTVLFALVMVAFPSLVLTERLRPALPILLPSIMLAWAGTFVVFVRAYRRVCGSRPPLDGWLGLALSPVSLIRAPLALSLDVSAATHPVVGADVLCDDTEFLRVARLWHFDSAELRPAIEALADRRGLKAWLDAPPKDAEAGVALFCPRCHATFRNAATLCADCDGVTLAPLPT